MADPEVNVRVKLDDGDFQRKSSGIRGELREMGNHFRSVGREITEVSRALTIFGALGTTALAGTFKTAAKDLPEFGNQLKEISSSFQALADNIAVAAAPSLQSFVQMVNGAVYTISKFVGEHQKLVNEFIKYSGIAVLIGTVGLAFGTLWKTIGNVIRLGSSLVGFFISLLNPVTLVVAAVLALVAGMAWLSDKFLHTHWIGDFTNAIGKMAKAVGGTISGLMKDFEDGSRISTQRSIDYFGKFAEGVRKSLKSLADNVEEFGEQVSQTFQKAFSDTLFDAITGKLHGLRSVITQLGNDLLRAGLKQGTNALFGKLIGTAEEPNRGLLTGAGTGGFGSMIAKIFGGHSPAGAQDPVRKSAEAVKELTKQVGKTTNNLVVFQQVKDAVIKNLQVFGGQIMQSGAMETMKTKITTVGSLQSLQILGAGTQQTVATMMSAAEMLFAYIASMGGGGGGKKKGFGFGNMLGMGLGIALAPFTGGLSLIGTAGALMNGLGNMTGSGALSMIGMGTSLLGAVAGIGSLFSGAAGGAGALANGTSITTGETIGLETPGAVALPGGGWGIPAYGTGGIVRRPTLAMVGETGPEAIVPLNEKNSMGSTRVDIHIDTAMLNSPSNMRDFIGMLKEELAR